MNCKHCGANVADGAAVCPSCGVNLAADTTAKSAVGNAAQPKSGKPVGKATLLFVLP